MEVPMELARILITETGQEQVIFLREKDGERTFPILIGINEALAIHRRLNNEPTPRPMTHDLLASIIEALGGTLERIVISDLREHTFIATLHISHAGETIEVDSRPSDAIALGVAFDTPIFVAEHVLEEIFNTPIDKIDLLKRRMEMLREQMDQLRDQLGDEEFLSQQSDSSIDEAREQLDEMQREYEQLERILKKLE